MLTLFSRCLLVRAGFLSPYDVTVATSGYKEWRLHSEIKAERVIFVMGSESVQVHSLY
jgi:hypothetical protein